MKTKKYNIPNSWLRDLATCGTSSHQYYRTELWFDWTDTQREHALLRYDSVLEKLEKLCALKEENAQFFGDTSSVWFANLNQVIKIDLGEQYTPAQLLKLVDEAIDAENEAFKEATEEIWQDAYYGGDWRG